MTTPKVSESVADGSRGPSSREPPDATLLTRDGIPPNTQLSKAAPIEHLPIVQPAPPPLHRRKGGPELQDHSSKTTRCGVDQAS